MPTKKNLDNELELKPYSPAFDTFKKEPVTFLLVNALRHLTQEQQRQLCNALQERLPLPASITDEAGRLYPYDASKAYDVYQHQETIQEFQRIHIAAASQYIGEIEKLRAENSKMRKALEEIAQKYADAEVMDDIGQFVFEMGELATEALK